MKIIQLFFLIFIVTHINISSAQSKYWIFLKDKKAQTFNPYQYFDSKAIERRLRNGIPLCDSTDFPVNSTYILKIAIEVDSVCNVSRWFNAVTVLANEIQIENLKKLDFVSEIFEMQMTSVLASKDTVLTDYQMEILYSQTQRLGGDIFKTNNIDGTGIRVAIFDGGFPNVDKNSAFEHIRKDNRIKMTWDFVKNKEFVYDYNSHGTMVMSCIGGRFNGINIGLATGAEFILARTEKSTEPFSEEENWLMAAEWADKNGADIINSSLGYTFNRYFPTDMDGKTCFVARAANLAARKGILVVNAAGNDGDNKWKYIGTPADADSVLSVGGIGPSTNYHISFSSYGPTADKRLKPNVCAFGSVIAMGPKGITNTQGTSFSSPLVAGFAACALQSLDKKVTNMQLFKEIEKSGDLYPYYDYAHGYGVPQAAYFINKETKDVLPSFHFEIEDSTLKIVVDTIVATDKDTITGVFKCSKSSNYLFYHISKPNGFLESYNVIYVSDKIAATIPFDALGNGNIVRVHYLGKTEEYKY